MAKTVSPKVRAERAKCLADAKAWGRQHGMNAVYEGFKKTKGKRTKDVVLVFVVSEKKAVGSLSVDEAVPPAFGSMKTDVQVAVYDDQNTDNVEPVTPSQWTMRKRPCPAGLSIGHWPLVTAGTFGAPVKRGSSDEWLCLTNNHVAAASNDAVLNDPIIQPGKADNGQHPSDRWGTLMDFVTINFGGGGGTPPIPPIPDCPIGETFETIVNAILKMIGSRRIVTVGLDAAYAPPQAVGQPDPNLVDAALVRPIDGGLDPVVWQLGPIVGIRDLVLGETVQKQGRTTEHTHGTVVGVNGQVQVNYGGGKMATFDDQLIIESTGSSDFSAGGDSGSGILTTDMHLGGLLFAGGGGQTIANKISNVASLLGGLRVS